VTHFCPECEEAVVVALRRLMLLGRPCEISTVLNLSSSYDICERCAHSLGAALPTWLHDHPELGVACYLAGQKTTYFPAPLAIRQAAPARYKRFAI
jgi:hypothetical protein